MRAPPMVEFNIPQVTTIYVLKELNIKTGCDDISAQFLKTSASVIAPFICDLRNESINTSTFPDMWKVAKVKAAFKKGLQTEVDNYRSPATLCVISKIIEKHIQTNFSNFLEQYDLLSATQSGFRRGYFMPDCFN